MKASTQPTAVTGSQRTTFWSAAFYAAVVGVIILLAAYASKALVHQPEGIASISPASGFAVGILFINNRRKWQWLLPVIFTAYLGVDMLALTPPGLCLVYATVNTGEAALIAAILTRFCAPEFILASIRQFIRFFILIILAGLFSALVGAVLVEHGWGAGYWIEWQAWWCSHSLGILLIAPPVIAFQLPQPRNEVLQLKRLIEGLGISAGLLAVSAYLFLLYHAVIIGTVGRTYIIFPFLLAAALRLSPRFASSLLAVSGLTAIVGITFGRGLFAGPLVYPPDALLTAQLYVGLMAFSSLLVVAALAERKLPERITLARLRLVKNSQSLSLEELLRATLDEAEQLTGSQVGFYHLIVADDVDPTLQSWSSSTLAQYCYTQDSLFSHSLLAEAGVWADCVRERRPVIHNDYLSLPHRKGLPDGHVAIKNELVVPVLRGDKIVCVMGVGNKSLDYTRSDVETLAQIGDLTWEIIERKLADQALLKSEELLRETQTIAGVGGWQYDVLAQKVAWTSEVYQIYGVNTDFDPSDFSRAVSWYAPEDQQVIEQAFLRVINEGQPYDLELGFINAQGRHMWVRTTGRPVWEAGRVIKVTGTIADISERVQAQTALAHSEEQLRLAMDATSDGLWDWHCDENYTYYSPGYYRMLGYEPGEFPATPQAWIALVHPDDREKVIQVDLDTQENRIQSFEIEMRILARDGEWKWILSRAKTVGWDANGRALRVVGTHVDITERKNVEEALRNANRQLENRAAANQALQQLLIEQATHDALTGLHNRRYMDDVLGRELVRAARENYPVCVMMLDIDHFKGFNDTYGHDAGDQVLMALGDLLRASIRQSDIACRYGGEEFVIIMPGANSEEGRSRAELIRHEFGILTVEFEKMLLTATLSIGVALFPLHGVSADELLRAADSALYDAKSAGRNFVCLARL